VTISQATVLRLVRMFWDTILPLFAVFSYCLSLFLKLFNYYSCVTAMRIKIIMSKFAMQVDNLNFYNRNEIFYEDVTFSRPLCQLYFRRVR